MKKDKKNLQASNCKNNVTNKNNNNVTNSANKSQKQSNNIGFENESKSFQLDEDSSKSFELE